MMGMLFCFVVIVCFVLLLQLGINEIFNFFKYQNQMLNE